MSPKITDRTIRAMPYDSRIVRYNQEKNQLYRDNQDKPSDWLEEERRKLEKKWRV